MDKECFIIWSDDPARMEDLEEYKKYLAEECPELLEESDDELYLRLAENNNNRLEDEKINLDILLGHPIIAVASIGRWNGRVSGYKMIESGNIRDCLRSYVRGQSYSTFYVTPDGEFKQDESHHDGTNYITYRLLREGVTDNQLETLLNTIYQGTFSQRQINRLTRKLGPDIAKVYGWNLKRTHTQSKACVER